MEISIVNYFDKTINGSVFTLTDIYLELTNKNIKVKNYAKFFELTHIQEYKQLIIVESSIKKYCMIDYIQLPDTLYSDTIITSYYAINNIDFTNIKGKKLIIFDTLDVYVDYKQEKFKDVISKLKQNFNEIIILCNPFIESCIKNIKSLDVEILQYFSKVSKIRLEHYNTTEDDRTLVRTDRLSKMYNNSFLYNDRYKFLNTLKFKSFAFERMAHTENRLHIENIGKLFFEYLYIGKQVDYYPTNICMKDGMCYYMENLDIDPYDTTLNISIENKKDIVYCDNDILYEMIK